MTDNTNPNEDQSTKTTQLSTQTTKLRRPPAVPAVNQVQGVAEQAAAAEHPKDNAEFLSRLFADLERDEVVAVCSKKGDPAGGPWYPVEALNLRRYCPPDQNNYYCTSTLNRATDGALRATVDQAARYHILMADDVGTKGDIEALNGIIPTYGVETSPGNFQLGFKLDKALSDPAEVQRLQDVLVAKLGSDNAAKGMTRWARLPYAINGKPKHRDTAGAPFTCNIKSWNPELAYSPEQLLSAWEETCSVVAPNRKTRRAKRSRLKPPRISHEVLKLKSAEHPAITALKAEGLYKRDLGDGRHEITCFALNDHTDKIDSGTVFFEPSEAFPNGGFRCQHSHGDTVSVTNLYERIGVDQDEARHRHSITIVPGAIDQVTKAAEYVLAECGDVYQSGGLIVHVRRDPETGDPSIAPANDHSLTIDLASKADWGSYDGRTKKFTRRDPPERVVKALQKALKYEYLPSLKGIARQPFYNGDELVTTSGYHEASGIYASFCEDEFAVVDTSRAAAEQALELLLGLVAEVEFATDIDLAAAISAMFTATVRPSIPLAPAFLTTAPDSGIGKSYLNSIVTPFAGPGEPQRTSFPKTSEEATKSVQSHLLTGSAVIEYDDMDCDFLPHGALNRMLTSEHVTDRILGVSKTVTVSTRAVVLASGINVGPVRDMNRRVITIRLARKQQGGITRSFAHRPAKEVRANRGKYASAVFTIIEAFKAAGCPNSDAPSIASYGDEWSHYCRLPLMWLGLPDPAHSLIVQVDNDPDLEQFGLVLREWYARYQSTPVTVRKLKEPRQIGDDPLHEALLELPVTQNSYIIADKLGWLFKKKANKIIDGYALREGSSDGRKGWWVEKLPDPTPPLPASPPPVAENDDGGDRDGDG